MSRFIRLTQVMSVPSVLKLQRLSLAFLSCIFLWSLIATPSLAWAASNEIHYQSIESVRGDTAVVLDHSPGGDTRYACNIKDADCKKLKKSGAAKPKINGSTDYLASREGAYGVREKSSLKGGQTMVAFTIFDTGDDSPESVGSFSVIGPVTKKIFSPDEKTLVVIAADSTITSYDIPAKKNHSIVTLQADLPFFNVSPKGTSVSAYHYDTASHRIWNMKTGAMVSIKGAPSYVEFSESEDEAAFLAQSDGYKNLSVASGIESGSPKISSVASGKYLVEDYIYVGKTLYYLSNKESPLGWNIYARGESTPLAAGASYGDYLKRVGGKLAYVKIEGKNSNVYLYDPSAKKHARLDAAPSSSVATDITRSEITIADRTAALLSPSKTGTTKGKKKETSRNLFLWLHGGPQRQTSVGYHPYLSYAVYDELLEKLASGGNYVLKLDYSGSWGYGQDFIETLDRKVGVVETADIKKAIEVFKKNRAVDRVYLIGNSYGGYMAMKGVNEFPDLVDGIVSINGVSDWHGLIGTIPSSPFRELFDGLPNATTMPLYNNASVFTNVDAIDKKMPLVILYGKEDKTVPVTQSILYDAFMRNKKKNVSLTSFKGEGHVLEMRSTLTKLCTTIADKLSLGNIACK